MIVGQSGLQLTNVTRAGRSVVTYLVPFAWQRNMGNPITSSYVLANNQGTLGLPIEPVIYAIESRTAEGATTFSRDEGVVFAVVPTAPPAGAMFPPIGPANLYSQPFRGRTFLASEVAAAVELSNAQGFTSDPTVVTANNPITHQTPIDNLINSVCAAYSFIPPFSNLSGMAIYYHRPLRWLTWIVDTAEYGAGRAAHQLEVLMAIADRAQPIDKRTTLAQCFVQNVGLPLMGDALMSQAIPGIAPAIFNETGGHAQGIAAATYATSFLLRSHSDLKAEFDLMMVVTGTSTSAKAGNFYESEFIGPDQNGVTRYGQIGGWGGTYGQANCLRQGAADTADGISPGEHPYYYCLTRYTPSNLKDIDAAGPLGTPAGGGYLATGTDGMLSFAALLKMIPAFEAYVGSAGSGGSRVRSYFDRVFSAGMHTYDPAKYNIVRDFLQASASAAGQALPQTHIDLVFVYLQSQEGLIPPRTGNGHAWLRTWYRKSLGLGPLPN